MPERQVMVGKVVVQLAPYNPNRKTLAIYNNGNANIYISTSRVNVREKGYPIPPFGSISFVKAWGDTPEDELWVVGDAEQIDVRIWETFG
jgi:hypothetical protein